MYTNSKLITSTMLSPNYTEGRKTINRITIHHTATGPINANRIGEIFKDNSRKASCNYGIGNDGSICLIVEEKNRAWTSSSKTNDMSAITYEVSNSKYGEPWEISDKAYEAMINLSVDICKRYGIKEVFNIQDEIKMIQQKDRASFANNYYVPKGKLLLTQHNYFVSTACPGTYIKNNFNKICEDINKRLGNATVNNKTYTVVKGDTLYSIAARLLGSGSRYKEIMELNNLTSTVIYPGQTFKICEDIDKGLGNETVNNKTYTVVKGDTLFSIAVRLLGSGSRYKEIMELNNLTSTVIYPGQTFKIPS